jgi:signal transduction histidine kinase
MKPAEIKIATKLGTKGPDYFSIGPEMYAVRGEWQFETLTDSPFGKIPNLEYIARLNERNYFLDPDEARAIGSLLEASSYSPVSLKIKLQSNDGVVMQLCCSFLEWKKWPATFQQASPTEVERRSHPGEYDWSRIEAELLSSKLLIEAVIQSEVIALSVLIPVYRKSAIVDFKWILANKFLKAMAGGKNVVDRSYSEVFPDSLSNDVLNTMKHVYTTGQRRVNEVYYQDSYVKGWMRQSYFKSRDYLIVSAEDITLNKKAEDELKLSQDRLIKANEILAQRATAEFRTLFRSIDQGFAILQPDEVESGIDYVILQVNPAFESLARVNDAVGAHIGDLFQGSSLELDALFSHVFATLQSGRTTISLHDKTQFLEVYAFPAAGVSSQRIAVLLTDITERKRSEQKLKELNMRLREIDAEKTAFFANVSHEFRTPLSLMLSPLGDLSRQEGSTLTPQQKIKVDLALRNAKRLQKLVNTLLDFSRMENGTLDTFFQPTAIDHYTTDLASTFQSIIEEAGLKFVVKVNKINQPLYVNREMWEKIVFNLLSNAFKFTHAGKIELTLKEMQTKVQLLVKDTGVGISASNLKRIFERFTRIEGAKGRTYEGSGIGLALVRELIQAHHGSISVKSVEGKGSTFTVSIPKGKAHLQADHIFETAKAIGANDSAATYIEEARGWLPERQTARTRTANFQSAAHTVLVVDDNADMRTYLRETLQHLYHVIPVENGQKAFNMIMRGMLPDLIITDVMMPEMDGYDLLSAVKNNKASSEIPVILLTAKSGEDAVIEGMASGADDYIVKPFTSRYLLAMVQARFDASSRKKRTVHELREKTDLLQDAIAQRTRNLDEIQQSLKQTSQKLTLAEAELNNYTFIASHDLREPLRKIRFFSSILEQEEGKNLSSRGKATLGRMLLSVERLSGLINDVVTFASLSLPASMNRSQVDLSMCVNKVLKAFSSIIEEKNVQVEVGYIEPLVAVGFQVEILLRHLISNAIKFHRPNVPPVIKINGKYTNQASIEGAAEQSGFYQLTIQDNGIGFDSSFNEKIFRMFQRLYATEQFDGRGIGLAICKKVMENHHGVILANSHPDEGSTFTCLFPVYNSDGVK